MPTPVEQATALLSAPLRSPVPDGIEVVSEDDVRLQRGPRSYRVRGLAVCRMLVLAGMAALCHMPRRHHCA